jgi:cell division septation protein DedD
VSTETLPTAAVDKVAHQSASAGRWSVQVASFSVRATSERIAAELKSKGYQPNHVPRPCRPSRGSCSGRRTP